MLLALLSSCKDKIPEDPRKEWFSEDDWAALQKADFGCSGIYSDYYVKADMDGETFCINAEGADTCYSAKSQTVITGSNGVSLVGYGYHFCIGDKDSYSVRPRRLTNKEVADMGELENEVEFRLNYETTQNRSPHSIIDSFFKTGIRYPLNKPQSVENDPNGVFTLTINTNYDVLYLPESNGLTSATIKFTTDNVQPASAFLELKALKKVEFEDHYLYEMSFDFAGDLYTRTGANLWAQMTNGVMKGKFRINK